MDVNRSTVNHLWKQASKYVQNGRIQDWKHVESKSCLRNCFTKYVPDLLKEAIEEVPVHMCVPWQRKLKFHLVRCFAIEYRYQDLRFYC
jgi:hypothetical protein